MLATVRNPKPVDKLWWPILPCSSYLDSHHGASFKIETAGFDNLLLQSKCCKVTLFRLDHENRLILYIDILVNKDQLRGKTDTI